MEAKDVLKRTAELADEVMKIAEEREMTLAELFYLPDAIKNRVLNEMKAQEIKFKRTAPEK